MSTYVNAMSLPAAAVPVGRTRDGLPIGVQVIGRRYREMEVLAVARELEQALGGWIEARADARQPQALEPRYSTFSSPTTSPSSSPTLRTAISTPGMKTPARSSRGAR